MSFIHCKSCLSLHFFPPSFDQTFLLFQIETREDEEQNVKLEETIELLRSAGYFRARIKGLSPFDKVAILIRNVLFNGIKYFFLFLKN